MREDDGWICGAHRVQVRRENPAVKRHQLRWGRERGQRKSHFILCRRAVRGNDDQWRRVEKLVVVAYPRTALELQHVIARPLEILVADDG